MSQTLLITGATGFIGHHLVRRCLERGDSVIALSRDAARARGQLGERVRIVSELRQLDDDTRVDAIVNLAGERILGLPWTAARRRSLLESRLRTTQAVVALADRLRRRPAVLVSASAIGYYGVHGDETLDENAAAQPVFQSQLCQQWEAQAQRAESLGVRVVRLRIGIVLGTDGGALPQLARPVRLGVGAVLGSGQSYSSWIHLDDLLRLIEFALATPGLSGAVNAVAPQAVRNRELQQTLASVLRRPVLLRVPAVVLRTLLGEMSTLLLDGQRVAPARALAAGFSFGHPELREALQDLLKR
jgi:uncharacterized protein (TIGR01777 family)